MQFDYVLFLESILIGILIVWWLEEFGIINIGFYSFLRLKPKPGSGGGQGQAQADDEATKPIQVFTPFNYPLEIDISKEGNDAISWNGSKQFSGIHSNFQFLQQLDIVRTLRWIKYQQKCVSDYLSSFIELRRIVRRKLNESAPYHQIINPIKKGPHCFYYRKVDALKEPSLVLMRAKSFEDSNPQVVIDILDITSQTGIASAADSFDRSKPSASYLVPSFVDAWISDDGSYVAIGISYADNSNSSNSSNNRGSNDNSNSYSSSTAMRIFVKHIDSDTMLSTDKLMGVEERSNVVWDQRSIGFFYAAKPTNSSDISSIKYHKLQTSADSDITVFSKSFNNTAICNYLKLSVDGLKLFVHVFKSVDLSELRTCYSESAGNALYSVDIGKHVSDHASSAVSNDSDIIEISSSFEFRFEYITSRRGYLWLRTNKEAPLFRIIKVSLGQATYEPIDVYRQIKNLNSICMDCISEDSEGAFLESADISDQNILVVKYLLHSAHSVMLFRIPYADDADAIASDSRFEAVPVAELPHSEFGCVSGPFCSVSSAEIIYKYTGFTDPGSVFVAKITRSSPAQQQQQSAEQSRRISVAVEREVSQIGINLDPPMCTSIAGFDFASYETRQIFVTGVDGSTFPIFIIASQQVFEERDTGNQSDPRPCLLSTYGGFGVSVLPQFSLSLFLFMKQCGGILCFANICGGGEYGHQYHRQGSGKQRATSVDNFIKVAEYLIENEYTTQQQLGVLSGGIGGLIAAASINKRPWLFSAAVIHDGLFDAHNHAAFSPVLPGPVTAGQWTPSNASSSSSTATAAAATVSSGSSQLARELGSSSADGSTVVGLGELVSPIHTVANRDIPYPAMLLVASNPAMLEETPCVAIAPIQHSLQFAAVLQHAVGTRPDQKKPLMLYIEEDDDSNRTTADLLAFLLTNLNAQWVVN